MVLEVLSVFLVRLIFKKEAPKKYSYLGQLISESNKKSSIEKTLRITNVAQNEIYYFFQNEKKILDLNTP